MLRVGLILCLSAGMAAAQDRRPSHCIALAESTPGIAHLHRASFGEPVLQDAVRLSYVDHSTFLIESTGGLTIATDFTGYLGAFSAVPDVVTMNHAHTSHWTGFPDPRIAHVLRGWGDGSGPADHYLELGDMLIRNVPTDIRSRAGGGVEKDGNSIFVFEAAGLCIGHLGHLHHEPSAEQYAAIGRLDVVMAAVDGGLTLDLPTITRVLKRLRARIVIPMHWFSGFALDAFLNGMRDDFEVVFANANHLDVSLRTLPSRPRVVVLAPGNRRDPGFDD